MLFLWLLHVERKAFFLLQQDIVSLNRREASGEQRVGLIISIFAVSLRPRGIICPESVAKEGTYRTMWNASVPVTLDLVDPETNTTT